MVKPSAGRMTAAEAETKLRGSASGLPPAILAAGGDDFLRERLVRACRAGAGSEGSEFQRLEGDALDAETLASDLATLSLFGGARRVWIREGSKMDRAVEETLLGWMATPGEGVFVLVTTARDPGDLKFLEALSSKATTVTCALRPGEGLAWTQRLAAEEGLKLPGSTVEALWTAMGDLLSVRQEIEKLAAHADAEGRVPIAALDSLRGARIGASLDRWAAIVLTGTAAASRAETQALAREGVGGTSALWAIAQRALASLEPQGFGYRGAAPQGPPLQPHTARAVLDAVYRADRALKRGDIRDYELADRLVQTVRQATRG